jgi:hypothetical protein
MTPVATVEPSKMHLLRAGGTAPSFARRVRGQEEPMTRLTAFQWHRCDNDDQDEKDDHDNDDEEDIFQIFQVSM